MCLMPAGGHSSDCDCSACLAWAEQKTIAAMRSTDIDVDLSARIREIQQNENRYQQCRHSFDSRCICLWCGDHYAAATARGERTSFPEDNHE